MDTVKAESAHWRQAFEYVRLARAAELIGCDADQLLHLGAIGEVTLLAPVMAEGEYEWPVDIAGRESWREPFRATFDASDRVILHRRDVAKIEAMGWVIPRLFFSPDVARQIASRWNSEAQGDSASFRGLPKDVAQPNDARVRRQSQANEINVAQLIKLTVSSKGEAVESGQEVALAEMSPYESMIGHADIVPWFPVDTRLPLEVLRATTVPAIEDKTANRTTVDHLFVSMAEIERLKQGASQDDAAEKRKTEPIEPRKRHRRLTPGDTPREQVLLAAMTCYFKQLNPSLKPPTGVAWVKAVDEKGGLFWRTGSPPMSVDEMERLLRSVKDYPKQAEWDGGPVKKTNGGEQ
ncbi:hypothetical protein CJO90_05565 [Ralstonia solanacearum]|nr:hypothetical protein CJO90_05565 [Ralstonia solanacearum]